MTASFTLLMFSIDPSGPCAGPCPWPITVKPSSSIPPYPLSRRPFIASPCPCASPCPRVIGPGLANAEGPGPGPFLGTPPGPDET